MKYLEPQHMLGLRVMSKKGLDAYKTSFREVPFSFVCDPVGIQTQDLQNRNLTLYSAKLRDRQKSCLCDGFL